MQAVASIIICLTTISLSIAGVVVGVQNLLEADSAGLLVATQPWRVLPIPLGIYVALPATQTLLATWAPSRRLRNVICSGAAELVVLTLSVCSVLSIPVAAIYSAVYM